MKKHLVKMAVALALASVSTTALGQDDEARSLEEVRNTVINLLEALVQKGVMTKEQAQEMVAAAQSKAATDAEARAARDAAESDAVRVTYVPEIVQQQISKQVSAEIKDDVAKQVVAQAQVDGWAVPGALPEWIRNVRLYGDVRARAEGDLYASNNAIDAYPNFGAINEAGGIGPAGEAALLNTTEDRNRLIGRVRAGFVAQLGNSFNLDVRLATGNARSPVSTNQTMGNYGNRWAVNVDRAAVIWNPINTDRDREFDFRFGRFSNPFVSFGELIWDNDLSFEGISATYAFDFFGNDPALMERGLFLTLGAFPLQEEELTTDDKWLYAGQLGAQFALGSQSRLRFTAGYFEYDNITGIRNTFNSTAFDFTAPGFLQKGNTLFDIRNDSATSTQLFALAGEYQLATANLWLDLGFDSIRVSVGGEYVKNIGWDKDEVFRRTDGGVLRDERTEGYETGVIVGHPAVAHLWDWRAAVLYRYVQRDAVLDAFTDSDFHLGGTDAKGYQIAFDLGLSRGAWLRLRYLTANEIDGPPLGIDVWQLDLNGSF